MAANNGADRSFKPPVPQRTWVQQEPEVPPVVTRFLNRYHHDHYELMAKDVANTLEERLRGCGVLFKLSARAKDKKSLKQKLIMRIHNEGKVYNTPEDIEKDVMDLAGVRVILYMPTSIDNARVRDVIRKEWGSDIEEKTHPPPRRYDDDDDERKSKPKYRQRHLGYRAVHYRIPLQEPPDNFQSKTKYTWVEGDQVEIQVVSALTHAWAEVGHDILYKTTVFGQPTVDEERTLDALNGLIQSGDLLLESFQGMFLRRTSQPFEYREQLTDFIRRFFNAEREKRDGDEDLEMAEWPRGEGLYILFKFLEKTKLNSPLKLLRPLEQLRYPYEHLQNEREIRESFNPRPEFARDMSLVICLIRHLLSEIDMASALEAPPLDMPAKDMCAIMMSTLTILQFTLGDADAARDYLQKTTMTPEEMTSMNFLLNDPNRYETLVDRFEQAELKSALQAAWDWFHAAESDANSLCGFLFRLAEMGCKKDVDAKTQLEQLHIGPLSRSGTANMQVEDESAIPPLGRASNGFSGPVGSRR